MHGTGGDASTLVRGFVIMLSAQHGEQKNCYIHIEQWGNESKLQLPLGTGEQ
jgi:hypothetical protein